MGYYAGMLAYYWVLATPAVGFLFGCYLYVAVNLFHCHYDEAFSALRIPHYKGFSRLHLTKTGDLVIYALAMDQVTISLSRRVTPSMALRRLYACTKAAFASPPFQSRQSAEGLALHISVLSSCQTAVVTKIVFQCLVEELIKFSDEEREADAGSR